jgi:hypothetical protein
VIPLANRPNVRVRHKDGWEVDMYLSPKLRTALDDRDYEIREDARRAVCTRFRMACRSKYLRWPGYWVNWKDLVISVLEHMMEPVASRIQSAQSDNGDPHCKCDTPFRCPVHDS